MTNSTNDAHENLHTDLQRAASRVAIEENLKILAVHEKYKDLINQKSSIMSLEILGKRELYEISKRKENDKELSEDEILEKETQLREECDQLQKVLIKNKTLVDSLQEAAFQTQMQNAVFENLNPDETISPQLGATIQISNENSLTSSKLAEAISVMEASERKILSLRIKYRTLLQTIENKWKIINGVKPNERPGEQDNSQLKKFQEKLNLRRERLQLLVCILQGLISSSGEKWGTSERILEIMLLCDKAQTFLSGYVDVGEDVRNLNLARKKDEKTKKTRMEKFVSSTPK